MHPVPLCYNYVFELACNACLIIDFIMWQIFKLFDIFYENTLNILGVLKLSCLDSGFFSRWGGKAQGLSMFALWVGMEGGGPRPIFGNFTNECKFKKFEEFFRRVQDWPWPLFRLTHVYWGILMLHFKNWLFKFWFNNSNSVIYITATL